MPLNRVPFLNTFIDAITREEALAYVDQWVQDGRIGSVITPNTDQIVQLELTPELRKVWNSAELLLLDGHPLLLISKLYGMGIKEKVSGSDFVPCVCDLAAQKGYRVFLLGAAPGVAEQAAENLRKRYPGLQIAGTYSPPLGFEEDVEEIARIICMLESSKADILVLGLGAPKQELFAYEYMASYCVPVTLCTGAAIDFIAGAKKRAPLWMRKAGLEWLFRLIQEPRRIGKRVVRDLRIIPIAIAYRPGRHPSGTDRP